MKAGASLVTLVRDKLISLVSALRDLPDWAWARDDPSCRKRRGLGSCWHRRTRRPMSLRRGA